MKSIRCRIDEDVSYLSAKPLVAEQAQVAAASAKMANISFRMLSPGGYPCGGVAPTGTSGEKINVILIFYDIWFLTS